MSTDLDPKTFKAGPARLAFPALFKPAPVMAGSEELKFQAKLLLPADTDLTPYREAIQAAMLDKWGKMVKCKPGKIGLYRVTEWQAEKYDVFELGGYYINARSKFAPGVVDQRAVPVTDETIVYGGCWVLAFLTCYAWDNSFGRGVNFGLEAIQKYKDDQKFSGGKVDATKVFQPLKGSAAPARQKGAESLDDVLGGEFDDADDGGEDVWMDPPAGIARRTRRGNDDNPYAEQDHDTIPF